MPEAGQVLATLVSADVRLALGVDADAKVLLEARSGVFGAVVTELRAMGESSVAEIAMIEARGDRIDRVQAETRSILEAMIGD